VSRLQSEEASPLRSLTLNSITKFQRGLAVVDFTNPKACEWYVSKLEALIDMGVDSLKVRSYSPLFDEHLPLS